MTITGIASGTDPYQVSSGQPNLFKQMRHEHLASWIVPRSQVCALRTSAYVSG